MKPVMIQAHLNENAVDTAHVPLVPDDVVVDAIACARAGAPWIHFHARDAAGGQFPGDLSYYRDVMVQVRHSVDVVWHPPQGFAPTPQERWAHVEPLVTDPATGLEVITIDPGSTDMMDYDPATKQVHRADLEKVYMSLASPSTKPPVPSLEHWLWFCEEARRLQIKPVFGVLEPGYLRRILAWLDMGLIDEPVVLHFFFTERLSYGLPAEVEFLETYLRMVPSWMRFEWFVCPMLCRRDRQDELIARALERGGHLRVGLGYPPLDGFAHPRPPTNAELIAETIGYLGRFGMRAATVAETRALLGLATPRFPAPAVATSAAATDAAAAGHR